MKRILILSVVLLFGFGINAQTTLVFTKGFKANATMSNFLLENSGSKSNLGFGALIGSSDKLEIGEHFALQGELLFRYGTSDIRDKTTGAKNRYQNWSVEVPTYAVGQIKVGLGKAFFGIGPYIGLELSAKSNTEKINLYKKDKITGESTMSHWDFGGGAILGYEFANKIFVDATYRIGFLNLLNVNKDGTTMRNQVFSLGLGYRFQLFSIKLDKTKSMKTFFD
jgi:hypothetical protein